MANPQGENPNDVYVGTFNYPGDGVDQSYFKDKDDNFYCYNTALNKFFPGHPILYWDNKNSFTTHPIYWAQVTSAMRTVLSTNPVKPTSVKQLYDNDTYLGIVPWHSSAWANSSPYHFFKTCDEKFYYWCDGVKPEFSAVTGIETWRKEINFSPVFRDFWLAAVELMEKTIKVEVLSTKCCCLVGPDMNGRYHSSYCGMYITI